MLALTDMDRAVVIVSRVYGLYPWRHNHARECGWFERRMDLMERITLPALARVQVPLVWAWQAHRTKTELVATYLQQLDVQGIDVRLVDQSATTHPDIWPGVEKFITFRVDTDDAWLPSAIEGVARRPLADHAIIDFRRGVALDWQTGQMRHHTLSLYQGPFLALTQNRDRMLDTGGNHREAREGRTVEHIDDMSWIQVIHGGNALNRLPPEPSRFISKRDGPCADGAPVDAELYRQILSASGIRLDSPAGAARAPSTAPSQDQLSWHTALTRRLGALLRNRSVGSSATRG
jgi:hypothetical protein